MKNQITIREAISETAIAAFWEQLHTYHRRDIFPDPKDENLAHFLNDAEYRAQVEHVHNRPQDRCYYLFFHRNGQDIGFVGDIREVNPKVLYDLLEKDFLPIVAPIGLDDEFRTYNINADDAACAIAKAVGANKLVFLTDIEGLYKDINDKDSFISRIRVSAADALIQEGIIGGGMLPKLNNCTSAVKNGVSRVHILDGRIPHSMLLEIFTHSGIGTAIVPDDDPISDEK